MLLGIKCGKTKGLTEKELSSDISVQGFFHEVRKTVWKVLVFGLGKFATKI